MKLVVCDIVKVELVEVKDVCYDKLYYLLLMIMCKFIDFFYDDG